MDQRSEVDNLRKITTNMYNIFNLPCVKPTPIEDLRLALATAKPGKLDLRRCLTNNSFLDGVGFNEGSSGISFFGVVGLLFCDFLLLVGLTCSMGFDGADAFAAFLLKTNPQSSSSSAETFLLLQ